MSFSAKKIKNQGAHRLDELHLTGREVSFAPNDVIVSKTDIAGIITYVNDVFIDISGFSERELLGQPHSIIRHPHMPRCIFKLLWETIKSGDEIFAYVVNRCKNGDHYWVSAHVTPSFDDANNVIGYRSTRRCPRKEAVQLIQPIYQNLLELEKQGRKEGLEASSSALQKMLESKRLSYEVFIQSF